MSTKADDFELATALSMPFNLYRMQNEWNNISIWNILISYDKRIINLLILCCTCLSVHLIHFLHIHFNCLTNWKLYQVTPPTRWMFCVQFRFLWMHSFGYLSGFSWRTKIWCTRCNIIIIVRVKIVFLKSFFRFINVRVPIPVLVVNERY